MSARKRPKRKKRRHVRHQQVRATKKPPATSAVRTPSVPATQPSLPPPAPTTATAPSTTNPTTTTGPAPVASTAPLAATSRERLFLNRFGTGLTQRALRGLRAAGTPEQWLAAQLQPGSVTESAKITAVDSWYPDLRRTPSQMWATQVDGTKGGWEYGHDLGNWTIMRRIYSERSVLETMTDFWSTNLHVPVSHDRAWLYRFDYDATIRTHALGTFEDLLTACSLHPAMRTYLDNFRSVKGSPNENQGRELLELHTVGRAAGYTEAMVKASAVLLSGYTVDWGKTYAPYYNSAAHTTGPVTVLGFSHPNSSADGQAATLAYLKYLAHHPATARNLAQKLARYFVGDSPSDGLVSALASAYLDHGTSIEAMLTALAGHPEFLASTGNKVRTAVGDLVATARVLDVDVLGPHDSSSYTRQANWTHGGQALFAWPRPDGPPVNTEAWSSASRLFASYGMHLNHAGGWWPKGATYRAPQSWLPGTSVRFDAFVQHLALTWFGKPADARMLTAAQQAVSVSAATLITATHSAATWNFPRLAIALLDSPDHMTT